MTFFLFVIAGMDSAHNWDAAFRKSEGPSAIVCLLKCPKVSFAFILYVIKLQVRTGVECSCMLLIVLY